MCNNSCRECSRKVFTSSVSIQTIDNVDTLVIDVPSQVFANCQQGCLVVTQNIPDAATIFMPVAISIGGETTTVYNVVSCDCNQVTAPMLRTRVRYPFKVSINGTVAVFKILKNLCCANVNNLQTIGG